MAKDGCFFTTIMVQSSNLVSVVTLGNQVFRGIRGVAPPSSANRRARAVTLPRRARVPHLYDRGEVVARHERQGKFTLRAPQRASRLLQ
jgi:hypothetical protein